MDYKIIMCFAGAYAILYLFVLILRIIVDKEDYEK